MGLGLNVVLLTLLNCALALQAYISIVERATASPLSRFLKRSVTPKLLRRVLYSLNGQLTRKWSGWDHVEHSQVCSYAVRSGVEQKEVMGLDRTQGLTGCCPLTSQGAESSAQ